MNENLSVEEVVQEDEFKDLSLDYYYIAIMSSWDIYEGKQFAGISLYNKNYFGSKIYLIDGGIPEQSGLNLGLFIQRTKNDKHIEDISDIFIIPRACVDETTLIERVEKPFKEDTSGITFTYYEIPFSYSDRSFLLSIDKQLSFSDYVPKNNKCFCYPYNYLTASNNNGNMNLYKYENFGTDKATFSITTAIGIGGAGRCIPLKYKKMDINDDESIPLAKYPTCGWSADSYTNWLSQQAVNVPFSIMNLASSAATSINGATNTAQVAGSVTNIAGQIGNLIGQFYSASLLPNIGSSSNTGDVSFASSRTNIIFRKMRAKTEFMKIIDNYFSRFGYAINETKIPNISHRQNWNYIEIGPSEAIGYGSVPSNFMEIINGACRRGVTIWHNHKNLGNFSLDNKII